MVTQTDLGLSIVYKYRCNPSLHSRITLFFILSFSLSVTLCNLFPLSVLVVLLFQVSSLMSLYLSVFCRKGLFFPLLFIYICISLTLSLSLSLFDRVVQRKRILTVSLSFSSSPLCFSLSRLTCSGVRVNKKKNSRRKKQERKKRVEEEKIR
jgi:hypothetical protein